MAKRPVVEVVCGRCCTKEYLPYAPDNTDKEGPDLIIVFEGKEYQFDDLCSKCKKYVRSYVQSAVKDVGKSRRERAKKKGPDEQVPSS